MESTALGYGACLPAKFRKRCAEDVFVKYLQQTAAAWVTDPDVLAIGKVLFRSYGNEVGSGGVQRFHVEVHANPTNRASKRSPHQRPRVHVRAESTDPSAKTPKANKITIGPEANDALTKDSSRTVK